MQDKINQFYGVKCVHCFRLLNLLVSIIIFPSIFTSSSICVRVISVFSSTKDIHRHSLNVETEESYCPLLSQSLQIFKNIQCSTTLLTKCFCLRSSNLKNVLCKYVISLFGL